MALPNLNPGWMFPCRLLPALRIPRRRAGGAQDMQTRSRHQRLQAKPPAAASSSSIGSRSPPASLKSKFRATSRRLCCVRIDIGNDETTRSKTSPRSRSSSGHICWRTADFLNLSFVWHTRTASHAPYHLWAKRIGLAAMRCSFAEPGPKSRGYPGIAMPRPQASLMKQVVSASSSWSERLPSSARSGKP